MSKQNEKTLTLRQLDAATAKHLSGSARVMYIQEGIKIYADQESKARGISGQMLLLCKGATFEDAEENFKKAEKAWKKVSKATRMPGAYRVMKSVILTAMKHADWDNCDTYYKAEELCKSVRSDVKEASAKEHKEAVNKAMRVTDAELAKLSPEQLRKAIVEKRRQVLEAIGKLPDALQFGVWNSAEVTSVVANAEKQYQRQLEAVKGIAKDTDAKDTAKEAAAPKAAAAAGG